MDLFTPPTAAEIADLVAACRSSPEIHDVARRLAAAYDQSTHRKKTDSMVRSIAGCRNMDDVRYVLRQCGYTDDGHSTRT